MRSDDAAKHEVWRLFVAVDLPDEVKKQLEQIQRALRSSGWQARWSKPENTHLTLKFFGNRPVDSVEALRSSLRTALAGTHPFELRTDVVGAFPNARRPRVIWLGIRDRTSSLNRIATEIETQSRRLGIEPDDRSFRPHLTIGRMQREDRNSTMSFERQLQELGSIEPIPFNVDHGTLYRSDLQRGGPIYTVVDRFDFGTD